MKKCLLVWLGCSKQTNTRQASSFRVSTKNKHKRKNPWKFRKLHHIQNKESSSAELLPASCPFPFSCVAHIQMQGHSFPVHLLMSCTSFLIILLPLLLLALPFCGAADVHVYFNISMGFVSPDCFMKVVPKINGQVYLFLCLLSREEKKARLMWLELPPVSWTHYHCRKRR